MAPTAEPNRWAVLALLGTAQLMVVLDATIVNIALPSAQADLGFDAENRQWIITAYALAFGSLLLVGGKLGDLFGRKWTFIAGLIGFSVASALGGLAQSFGVLVGARALQGVFGALLAPSALSLLTVTFAGAPDRPKAFGIFGAIAGGGASVGLLLGGILTEALSWRWCLYVNLVIALPAALVALQAAHRTRATPRGRRSTGRAWWRRRPACSRWCTGSPTRSPSRGRAPLTLACFAASAVLLTSFVFIERRTDHPLLPLHIVWDRGRGGAYASIALAGSGVFGVFLFLTFYMQQTLGFSALKTGVAFLPMTAVIVVTSTTVQTKLLRRVGARKLITVRHDPRPAGDALLHPPGAREHLRRRRAAGAAGHRRRHGLHLRPRVRHRHAGRPGHRGRRGLGHGQHLAAGGRVDRHRAAEHDLRHRGRRLRDVAHARSGPAPGRRGPRLHAGVLVGGGASSPWAC